jgi:hypothetical protein
MSVAVDIYERQTEFGLRAPQYFQLDPVYELQRPAKMSNSWQ